jgi:MFS family permease
MPFVLREFTALDRRIWYLAIARLVVTAGFSMVFPFLAMHLAVERKVPAFAIGLIWTIAGACGAATQWLAGELCDRIGRRPVMLAAMVIRSFNLVGMGLAVAYESPLYVVGALTVVNAVLRSFFDPVANAMVADLAPVEQRVAAFSLQRVGINIGWAAGPAAGALAAGYSYSTLFYWSAPITLLAMTSLLRIREPARECAPRTGVRWTDLFAFREDRVFLRFLLATAGFYVLQVQLYQTLSIYAARHLHLDRAEVGSMYTLNGLLVVMLQLPAVRYIRRLGNRRALALGCVGYAAAYACVGLAQGYAGILACVTAVTLAEIVTAPAQQATVTSLAPTGRVGTYSGLFGLSQVVGQSAGPTIGTATLDAVPPRAAWFLLALFGIAAALAYRGKVGTTGTAAPTTTPKNVVA